MTSSWRSCGRPRKASRSWKVWKPAWGHASFFAVWRWQEKRVAHFVKGMVWEVSIWMVPWKKGTHETCFHLEMVWIASDIITLFGGGLLFKKVFTPPKKISLNLHPLDLPKHPRKIFDSTQPSTTPQELSPANVALLHCVSVPKDSVGDRRDLPPNSPVATSPRESHSSRRRLETHRLQPRLANYCAWRGLRPGPRNRKIHTINGGNGEETWG